MANKTAEREIVVERLIDAPREMVYAAFTEQEHAEKWWVTNGTTHEWHAEPGGAWRYTMPGHDGSPAHFKVTFVEFDKPQRFVYDYGMDMENAPEPVRTTVTFEDEGGKTRVTLQLRFATAEEREQAAQYGAAGGASQALKALDEYVTRA